MPQDIEYIDVSRVFVPRMIDRQIKRAGAELLEIAHHSLVCDSAGIMVANDKLLYVWKVEWVSVKTIGKMVIAPDVDSQTLD